jgi:hypothetical protein
MFATAIILLIFLPIENMIIGFFRTKGSNYATKQDITDITQKIESVKALLQITVGNHTMIQEKRNESIIQFFEDSMALYHEKLILNVADGPIDGGVGLMEYQTSMAHLFTKIFSDYYRLLLYFDNDDKILASSYKLAETVQEVRKVFKESFWDYKKALIEEDHEAKKAMALKAMGKDSPAYAAAARTNKAAKIYYEKMNGPVNEVNTALIEYIAILNDYFKEMGYEKSIIEGMSS